MRGGIAERGGIRVGHRIIEINGQSVVAMSHEKIIQILTQAVSKVGALALVSCPPPLFPAARSSGSARLCSCHGTGRSEPKRKQQQREAVPIRQRFLDGVARQTPCQGENLHQT